MGYPGSEIETVDASWDRSGAAKNETDLDDRYRKKKAGGFIRSEGTGSFGC